MTLKSISLASFRNYSSASFTFSPQTTLIVGPNASGKTNLLEAVYFLATGRSFRATYDREMIRGGEVWARIKGIKGIKGVKDDKDEEGLEVTVLANENGENTSSKRFKVNGVKKRLFDFAGNLRAVYFGPEEIELVTGSPSRRRKYLDSVLSQVDREYARTLLDYEKVLRQRNRLLLLIRGAEAKREQLEIWDPKLTALGSVVSARRQEMLGYFNERLGGKLSLGFLKSTRSWPQEKIPQILEREIAAGMTLWGPHRDDFRFVAAATGRDLAIYGSRGEQRLAVLHLKMAELGFISQRAGERPTLLLDDVFSELDAGNRLRVSELLGKQQTIITATDAEGIKLGSEVITVKLAS